MSETTYTIADWRTADGTADACPGHTDASIAQPMVDRFALSTKAVLGGRPNATAWPLEPPT